jgi:hypothetical protein
VICAHAPTITLIVIISIGITIAIVIIIIIIIVITVCDTSSYTSVTHRARRSALPLPCFLCSRRVLSGSGNGAANEGGRRQSERAGSMA